MKIQVEGGKMVCFFLLILLAAAASSQKATCPFNYLCHFGDGFTDIGNSIHVAPNVSNPGRLPPYGITYPGWPTGRWCDGLVGFDYTGTHGINKALKSCCGIGGRYNYDSNRFCGRPGVPVCTNPNEYVYWDGFHFTQQAYYKTEHLLIQPALKDLGCTTSNSIQSYGEYAYLKASF